MEDVTPQNKKIFLIALALFCILTVILSNVQASHILGFGVFEVIPTDASVKGIIAGVTSVLSSNNVGIRQVVADDPMFENPELTVITEKPIDKNLLNKLLEVEGVEKIVVLN